MAPILVASSAQNVDLERVALVVSFKGHRGGLNLGFPVVATGDTTYFTADTTTELLDDVEWYWTPEWQAMEDEADEDWKAGRISSYKSIDEFLASL